MRRPAHLFGSRKEHSQRRQSARKLLIECLETRRVLSDVPIIIDNQSPASEFLKTGNWGLVSQLGYAGSILYNAAPNDGNEAANWYFQNLEPGWYRVAATWHDGASIYASNTPITILNQSTVIGTGQLNQRIAANDFEAAGVYWESIGLFNLTGSAMTVRMTDIADGYVIADAIRIERVTPISATGIVDNLSSGFTKTGLWGSTPIGYGASSFYPAAPFEGNEVAEWSFVVAPGTYRLSGTWYSDPTLANNTPISVIGAYQTSNLIVNQSQRSSV